MGACFCTGACSNGGRCPVAEREELRFTLRVKPRLSRRGKGWLCSGDGHSAEAATAAEAYSLWRWMSDFGRRMQDRLDKHRKWPVVTPRLGGKSLRERIGHATNG